MPESGSKCCVSEKDARTLAAIAGVHDDEAIASLRRWLEQETVGARKTPDLADQLRGDEDVARKELLPLVKAAGDFMRAIRGAPHALERIRMLYAEELPEVLPVDLGVQGQRRLDQDLRGLARLAAAIEATETNVSAEQCAGPALLGPRKVAQELARKYVELSYQPFHYHVADTHNAGNIWTHPHTSPGARFVAGALKTMFPNLNDTNLKNILQDLPQFTNRDRKSA